MANENILNEYLVKLGFTTDTVGYAQFANQLRDVSSLVSSQYLGMAKKVVEFQVAGVGAFGAIGAAALGILDKTAMADQQYRLLALHLYTTLPVARELKIALDALGQPLENVMWDPESAARFHQLVKDQQVLTEELGPDFEAQMKTIRDVRFEFSRFGVELQYLTMFVVKDLAEAFGTNIQGLLEKMRNFNSWFITHMPEIAQWIATKLKPILLDVRDVLKETGRLARDLALTFTNLVATISGDKSLEGMTFSWEKFGTAIDKAANKMEDIIIDILHFERLLTHLSSGVADIFSGNWVEAKKEFAAANELFTAGSGAAGGAGAGALIGSGFGHSER